jgi:hypothetical protein
MVRHLSVGMTSTATEVVSSELSLAIHLLAECELVLLHGGELQPGLGRKFKSVDAQLHKAADRCLPETAWAGADESRVGQRLVAALFVAAAR